MYIKFLQYLNALKVFLPFPCKLELKWWMLVDCLCLVSYLLVDKVRTFVYDLDIANT